MSVRRIFNRTKKFCLKIEDMDEFLKKEISINSLSYKSYKLFKRFGISTVYLQMNPAE